MHDTRFSLRDWFDFKDSGPGRGDTLINDPNPNGDTFSGLAAGDYVILVRDISSCTGTSAMITINNPTPLTYTAIPTSCYDGANNASIQITAASGNGGYLFQIDNGPWLAPTPTTDNTYTFTGLANGSYKCKRCLWM